MDATTTSFFDLDGYSLQRIISYLDMLEKLKLVVVDVRFVNMLKDSLAVSLIDMSVIQEHFGVAETKDILSKCGHCIKRIRLEFSMNQTNDEYHQLVPIYCPNLEEIELIGLKVIHSNTYAKLLETSKRARILRMKKCIVSNAGCLAISKLSQLDTLDLENSKLTGNRLNTLRKLAHLSLQHCLNFKSKNLVSIFKVTKLKTLNITDCTQFCIDKLVETQNDLQSVIVGNKYLGAEACQKICSLRNLRELSIRHYEMVYAADYLKELVREHKDTLQSLDIHFAEPYSSCPPEDFIESQILNRIMEFRNLRVLGLSCCSLLVNTDLVKVIKFCPDLEMIDIRASTFTDNAIIRCAENLDRLKFLDISYCNVRKRLYHLLVEIRQEKECREQLIVFIKHDTTLANWLKTECYEDYKHVVSLSLEPMRSYDNKGLLHRMIDLKQEKINPSIDKISLKSTASSLVTTPSLVNIDDNCLRRIMSFLNLSEKLQLVLSSNRFDDIFRHFLHLEVFEMPNIFEHFTVREVRMILQHFGSSIRNLQLRTAYHDNFDIEYHRLAAKYCTNLNELHCTAVDAETIKEILVSSAKTLSVVKLIDRPLMGDGLMDDEVWQRVSKLQNLKVLYLNNTDATGNHLGSLSQLAELDLKGCRKFQSEYFEAICKANKLRVLNIYECMELDSNAIRTLVDTQTVLERLTLSDSYKAMHVENVAKLRNLVDLRLHHDTMQCHYENIQRYLDSLIEFRCDQLQVLEIENFKSALTDSVARRLKETVLKFRNLIYLSLPENTIVDNDYVKRLVKACPQLEILDFRRSERLSDEGIVTAIEKLKNLRHFDLNKCKINNVLLTYQKILEIMKKRTVRPLTLYIRVYHVLSAFAITKEYEESKTYLVLSGGCVSDLDLDKYRRERSAKATRSLSPTQADNNYETTISAVSHVRGSGKRHRLSGREMYGVPRAAAAATCERFHIPPYTSPPLKRCRLPQPRTCETALRPSIMDLSNSCLSHLMTYLDTTNQLKMALLHDRFYHLMRPWASNIVFDMSAICLCFTLSEAQQILSKFADQVKRIHFVTSITYPPLDYLNLIKPYIPQLIEIEVNNSSEFLFEAQELFTSTQHLEVAKFKNCVQYEIYDFLSSLCNNKQLKVLEISHSSFFGGNIHKFVNVIELNLEKCECIKPLHFIDIFRCCKLKSLDIRHCYSICDIENVKVFDVLVETQIDLERLSISKYNTKKFLKVFQLPNLKHLRIDDDEEEPEIQSILDELLRYRRDDLLSLILYNSAANLTIDYCWSEVVQRQIEKFRNLQKVEIHQEPI